MPRLGCRFRTVFLAECPRQLTNWCDADSRIVYAGRIINDRRSAPALCAEAHGLDRSDCPQPAAVVLVAADSSAAPSRLGTRRDSRQAALRTPGIDTRRLAVPC